MGLHLFNSLIAFGYPNLKFSSSESTCLHISGSQSIILGFPNKWVL
jgi:hypothetical protein